MPIRGKKTIQLPSNRAGGHAPADAKDGAHGDQPYRWDVAIVD